MKYFSWIGVGVSAALVLGLVNLFLEYKIITAQNSILENLIAVGQVLLQFLTMHAPSGMSS